MKTSELSLSAFLMMLLTLVARCRVQLNPVINPFSPFYCPPLITPTLNYTHNPTARPACGVIHASVHLCCSIYSSQCLLCSYISIESFWKATKNKIATFWNSAFKEYFATSILLLFCGMGSSCKKWTGCLWLWAASVWYPCVSVVCEVQNIGWFCLTVSVCSCEMQKVGWGVCLWCQINRFPTNSKSFNPIKSTWGSHSKTSESERKIIFFESLEMNPNLVLCLFVKPSFWKQFSCALH